MYFPIQIKTISMGQPIVYFDGVQVEFFKLICSFVPEDANIDPDEMQHNAAFHLGLHCLPKHPFTWVIVQNPKPSEIQILKLAICLQMLIFFRLKWSIILR